MERKELLQRLLILSNDSKIKQKRKTLEKCSEEELKGILEKYGSSKLRGQSARHQHRYSSGIQVSVRGRNCGPKVRGATFRRPRVQQFTQKRCGKNCGSGHSILTLCLTNHERGHRFEIRRAKPFLRSRRRRYTYPTITR